MKRLVGVVLLAMLAAAVPTAASTFRAMSQGELVAQSSAVVRGEVLQVNSFWSPSGRVVLSEATVRVTDTIVGESQGAVVVRTFGGKVGGYTVEAHGFPRFSAGDKVLLFVTNRADGTAEVTGYRQGQYRIQQDAKGVEIAVPTLERGVTLLTPSGTPAPRPQALRLEDLTRQIRTEAARIGRSVN